MMNDKSTLTESCPTFNKLLRLCKSIRGHLLPALLGEEAGGLSHALDRHCKGGIVSASQDSSSSLRTASSKSPLKTQGDAARVPEIVGARAGAGDEGVRLKE